MRIERTARSLARPVGRSAPSAAIAVGVVAAFVVAWPAAAAPAEAGSAAVTIPGPVHPGAMIPVAAVPMVTADGMVDRDERATLRFVSQNILHGLFCPAETSACRLADRGALFMRQLHDAGCPEVVALQEANADVVATIDPHLATCGYRLVWDLDQGIDRELVLTTLDVVDSRRIQLAGGFRTAFAVRLDADVGPVDVITTHLASSSDNGPCAVARCPPPCESSDDMRECQARQLVETARRLASDGVVTVVGGDLNATVHEPAYDIVVNAGFVDSHLAAGRPECGPGHESSCTAGRESTSMGDLIDPASRQRQRIDYLFVDRHADQCEIGRGSGPFNAAAAAGPIAHPSDHTAVLLELTCPTATGATTTGFPGATTTVPAESAHRDAEAEAAVATAFETLFDGTESVERRLAHLEERDRLGDTFLAQLDAAGELAASTSARVESIALTSPTTADVVFSILLGDRVVFEHLSGSAVLENGTWLVSASTFCQLVTMTMPGATEC